MIYGYARVSTREQKLDRQIDSLTKYVELENIFTDKLSGKNTDRENYQKLNDLLSKINKEENAKIFEIYEI